MVFGLALLLADATPASSLPAQPSREIVVHGVSLQSLADELQRCIASHCPPRADVIASVRYAEGLFRSARYEESRRVLQSAIDRDKGAAKDDPDAVSALYEATETVARHDGEQQVEAAAIGSRLRLLRAVRPADSADLLRAELDQADLVYKRSSVQSGLAMYRAIAARADEAGQPAVAASARLRIAQAQHLMGEEGDAQKTLDAILATGDGLAPGYRLAAYAMRARITHGAEQAPAMATFRAALNRLPQPTPVLLSAPPLPLPTDPVDLNYFNIVDRVTRSSDLANLRWEDVGISIGPDGTVETAEGLRGSLSRAEVATITGNIAKRVYAAYPVETGTQYRIERWTLTADYATPIGSLIRRRVLNPHYEVLDITTGVAPGKVGAAS